MNSFGKFLRKYRIDQGGLSLRDMAKELEISASLLSSYETGRREIPDSLYQRILDRFPMKKNDSKKLRKAIDSTLEGYRVDLSNVDPDIRHRYVEFARKLDTFSLEDFEKLEIGNDEE